MKTFLLSFFLLACVATNAQQASSAHRMPVKSDGMASKASAQALTAPVKSGGTNSVNSALHASPGTRQAMTAPVKSGGTNSTNSTQPGSGTTTGQAGASSPKLPLRTSDAKPAAAAKPSLPVRTSDLGASSSSGSKK